MSRDRTAKGKVLVAMSGGVDSSVAALLLREAGYQVAGAVMRLWEAEPGIEAKNGLTRDAVADARRVAEHLHLPFQVFDFRAEFKAAVIAEFIAEYEAGRTPNPCILCNEKIKFALFLEKARALGFDYMATGHYVKRVFAEEEGTFHLEAAADDHKDQSYALYGLNQATLSRTLFPLGELSKAEVREKALAAELPSAASAESQEICFIPDNDYRRFLKAAGLRAIPGPLVNSRGQVLGRHEGLHNYTIGQRRGLGLTHPEPLYVVALEPEGGRVVVGTADQLSAKKLMAARVNIISPNTTPQGSLTAKIRYGARPVPCQIKFLPDGKMEVVFQEPVRAATPGQSVVVYSGPRVVGGGIIACIITPFSVKL